MMDTVGGEPGASLNRQSIAGFVLQRRDNRFEFQVGIVSQLQRQNSDDAPVIFSAHRKEKMKAIAKEIHVDLVRNHAARKLGVSYEKHVLIGRSSERDAT